MPLGSNIVNALTSSWGSNTGVGGGGSRVVKSLATGGFQRFGGVSSNGEKASEILNNLTGTFGVTSKIKEMLESYPLTNLFIGIYESIISDIVGRTVFDIKIEDAEDALVEDVNKFIAEIDIKSFICNNLRTSLYWGSYASPLFVNKETNKFHLGEFEHSERFVPAYYEGKLKSYVFKENYADDNFSSTSSSDDVIQIPADEVIYLGFDQHRKFSVVLDKDNKKGVDKILVNLNYRFSSGILDDCLYLLYNHLINTYISQLLTLKNALRPDVLMARATDEEIGVTEAVDDIENIESCLNNNEGGVIQGLYGGDPATILTNITSSILNQLKVVPSLNNYKDFEIIEFPNLDEKIAKLNQELHEKKLSIGNQLGIPEELLNSSSNRWEVVSRSATFQHAVNRRLNDISACIKQTVINYCSKYHGATINKDDIVINFDTNNILFNAEYVQKQQVLNDKLESFARMISNIAQIKEDPNIDRYEFDSWFVGQVGGLDPELKKVYRVPKLPEMIDPVTGQPIPPDVVMQMIQNGQIDMNGNPMQPPPGQMNMPPDEEGGF